MPAHALSNSLPKTNKEILKRKKNKKPYREKQTLIRSSQKSHRFKPREVVQNKDTERSEDSPPTRITSLGRRSEGTELTSKGQVRPSHSQQRPRNYRTKQGCGRPGLTGAGIRHHHTPASRPHPEPFHNLTEPASCSAAQAVIVPTQREDP